MEDNWKLYWDHYLEKVGDDPFKQVGRTENGRPMSPEMFQNFAEHVMALLGLESSHTILDLCCGNGLLSNMMSHRCHQVIGVDFSEKLIQDMNSLERPNLKGIVSDVMELKFEPESFDNIVLAGALQQFTQPQTIKLFKDMFRWLKPGGKLLVTDIADSGRMWNFYNSQEREDEYFKRTSNNTSVLGTWYDRVWLEKLSRFVGFSSSKGLDQPDDYWYSHYRFDLQCFK